MPKIVERVEKVVRVPLYQALFLKIAEPRIIRIMIFSMYASIIVAGVQVLMHRPEQFLKILGDDLSTIFGILLVLSASMGAVSVLPGIWWLERVGLILLETCVSWYFVIIIFIGGRPVTVGFVIGFGIFIAARFVEIRGAQLAPREV